MKLLIGVTSWQIPGTYTDNARILKNHVDFVELLVYTWDFKTENLLRREIEDITKLINFSVHLPTDSLNNCLKAIDFFKAFNPIQLTIHPMGNPQKFFQVFKYGKFLYGDKLSIENLENNKFETYYNILKPLDASITMDYGHLLITQKEPQLFYKKYAKYIREIHYHGLLRGKDHSYPDESQFQKFIHFVKENSINIPICIELFEIKHTLKLVNRMREALYA